IKSPLKNQSFIWSRGINANPLPPEAIEKTGDRGFTGAETRNFFPQKRAFSTSSAEVARYFFNMLPGVAGGAIQKVKLELDAGNQNRRAGHQRQPGQLPRPCCEADQTANR